MQRNKSKLRQQKPGPQEDESVTGAWFMASGARWQGVGIPVQGALSFR